MSNYDFRNLSPVDFEALVGDLLSIALGFHLEYFDGSRDQGIDLRYIETNGKTIVIQCKHYAQAGISALKSNLINSELKKIEKLKPDRYIIATSCRLSVAATKEIKTILSPWVKTTGDIFGNAGLNALIRKNPQIEQQHFKLWINSANNFDRILCSKGSNISRVVLDDIRDRSKVFVQNENFREALSILERSSLCVISGIPGIGKSTLAHMVSLLYVEKGYKLVHISEDAEEAYSYNFDKENIIFVYDDFLGQSAAVEKLHKNEASRLIILIKAIQRQTKSKLILTTREYILNQAREFHEELSRVSFDKDNCIVEISKFSRWAKGKLLFNHLYFSDVNRTSLNQLIKSKAYLKIVDHKNFNPRTIQLLTEGERVASFPGDLYCEHFLESLNHPTLIWEHSFRNQITDESRILLQILVTFPRGVDLACFEEAVGNFFSSDRTRSKAIVRKALKVTEGSFTKTSLTKNLNTVVSLHNPSIRDFLTSILNNDRHFAAEIANKAVAFEQVIWLWNAVLFQDFDVNLVFERLYQLIRSSPIDPISSDSFEARFGYLLEICEFVEIDRERQRKIASLVEEFECRIASRISLPEQCSQVIRRLYTSRHSIEFGKDVHFDEYFSSLLALDPIGVFAGVACLPSEIQGGWQLSCIHAFETLLSKILDDLVRSLVSGDFVRSQAVAAERLVSALINIEIEGVFVIDSEQAIVKLISFLDSLSTDSNAERRLLRAVFGNLDDRDACDDRDLALLFSSLEV